MMPGSRFGFHFGLKMYRDSYSGGMYNVQFVDPNCYTDLWKYVVYLILNKHIKVW